LGGAKNEIEKLKHERTQRDNQLKLIKSQKRRVESQGQVQNIRK